MVNFRLHVFTRRRDRRGISCRIINFHGAAKICPTKRTNCTKPCNLFCGKGYKIHRFKWDGEEVQIQSILEQCLFASQPIMWGRKKHTFTEVLTDKVFVRQYQTALPLVTLYWRSQMNVEIVDIIFQKCNVLETLILNANWPGSIISGPLKVEFRWYFGRLCFDRRLRPNNG